MIDAGTGIGGSGNEPQKGQRPLYNEQDYFDWAKANIGESLKNASAALGQMLTLSTSLLGGVIAFWNYIPLYTWYRLLIIAALLLTVLVCLFAAMPSKGKFDARSAADIKRYVDNLIASKSLRLRIAQVLLAGAISLFVVGLAFDAVFSASLACSR